MKYIKTYEKNYLESTEKGKEYTDYIFKEFDLENKPYGAIDYLDYGDSIKIYITIGTIDTNFNKKLFNFFENCDILIEPLGNFKLTVHIIMSDYFIKNILDQKISDRKSVV